MMEYKAIIVASRDTDSVECELNTMASGDWRVVAIMPIESAVPIESSALVIFEREKMSDRKFTLPR